MSGSCSTTFSRTRHSASTPRLSSALTMNFSRMAGPIVSTTLPRCSSTLSRTSGASSLLMRKFRTSGMTAFSACSCVRRPATSMRLSASVCRTACAPHGGE